MIEVDGRMRTANSTRYIAQLCDHLQKLSTPGVHTDRRTHSTPGEGPPIQSIERTSTGVRITFVWGECILDAGPSELLVRLTGDENRLATAQRLIGVRLEAFAHRENAEVTWSMDA